MSLDLCGNSLPRLPAALASATRLTELVLDSNRDLKLSAADVQDVLLPLRALRRLSLKGCPPQPRAALERLRSGLPLLQVVGATTA